MIANGMKMVGVTTVLFQSDLQTNIRLCVGIAKRLVEGALGQKNLFQSMVGLLFLQRFLSETIFMAEK
jgi:hypothetical protein